MGRKSIRSENVCYRELIARPGCHCGYVCQHVRCTRDSCQLCCSAQVGSLGPIADYPLICEERKLVGRLSRWHSHVFGRIFKLVPKSCELTVASKQRRAARTSYP